MMKNTAYKTAALMAFVLLVGLSSFTGGKGKTKVTPEGSEIHFIDAVKEDGTELSFNDLMAKFKGKIVFIDFWASWCGPCRGEFKFSPAIHEKFKDNKDVAFLYITFDRNKSSWEKAVDKFQLAGHHIFPGEQLKREVYEKFDVTGIPRYMIMGKDGRVLNDNAPRPSSKARLIAELNKYLK